jgi:hypothetical protein
MSNKKNNIEHNRTLTGNEIDAPRGKILMNTFGIAPKV